MSDRSHLDALCQAMGIQRRYTDQAGNPHEASSATLHAMLAALGYPVRDETVAAPVVAPSVEVAEETSIIWRWIEGNQARLVECTGSFSYPVQRVERLSSLRAAA